MSEYDLDGLAKRYHAYVKQDGRGFRRASRVLQSVWRETRGLPIGLHDGEPLGSRLPDDRAKGNLENYLTPGIQEVVRAEIENASDGELFAEPRIYGDLLSSQPLCFNLFAELKLNLDLATRVLGMLRPGSVRSVLELRFEY